MLDKIGQTKENMQEYFPKKDHPQLVTSQKVLDLEDLYPPQQFKTLYEV